MANQPEGILQGPELLLRCRDIHDISLKVAKLVEADLRAVARSYETYTFKSRHKSPTKIYDKVLRKRREGEEKNDDNLRTYNPDHVTDAWGCRYVTLFQTQIPKVVEGVLIAAEQLIANSEIPNFILSEFVIYTNRPPADPLSIVNEVMSIFDNTRIQNVVRKDTVRREPENKKSAYSSVHLVFKLGVTVDLLDRRSAQEIAKFEVQIRDIFEEGWGEIQHSLLYSQMDGIQYGLDGEEENAAWKPHLNALKTSVDGCSQLASIIQKNFELVRAVRAPSPWISATPRDQDLKAICAKLKNLGKEDAVPVVQLAYSLLAETSEAEITETTNVSYEAAAKKLEEALNRIGKGVLEMLPTRCNRTIEFFLKIELANCYLLIHRVGADGELQRAKQLCEEMAGRFPQDATSRFRLSQVLAGLGSDHYGSAIEVLRGGIDLLNHDKLLHAHHWMQLAARSWLGRLYWMSSRTLTDALREPKVSSLRSAVQSTQEAINFWQGEPDQTKQSETHKLFAHKAASNILYYLASLGVMGEASQPEIEEKIAQFNAIRVRPYAEYFRSRDNLMHAYYVLGKEQEARLCAFDTQSELVGIAERRAGRRLVPGEIESFLMKSERPSYLSASRLILGQAPEPGWKL